MKCLHLSVTQTLSQHTCTFNLRSLARDPPLKNVGKSLDDQQLSPNASAGRAEGHPPSLHLFLWLWSGNPEMSCVWGLPVIGPFAEAHLERRTMEPLKIQTVIFLIRGTSNLALPTLLTSERWQGDGNRTYFPKLIEIIQVKLVAHRKHWFYNGLFCAR